MDPVLKVDDINVYYGSIHAIKGVSFEVGQGEVVTLIGANGAGFVTDGGEHLFYKVIVKRSGHADTRGENCG